MKKLLYAVLLMMLMLVLGACSQASEEEPKKDAGTEEKPQANEETEKKVPKVAFVYIGTPADGGWTMTHDEGREVVDKTFGIKSTTVENVPEGPDAERVIEELAQKHDIIFTTSFGYMDPTVKIAAKYPDVTFMHATGYKTADNLATYQTKGWESYYLAGLTAGSMTENGKIGFVGAFPIPEVIYSLNAFTLAAQSINPDVEVNVVWSNTWFDPAVERQAAISLLDLGIDVLQTYQDSPAGIQAAEERGVWGMGNDADMSAYIPETYLTNSIIHWDKYYVDVIQDWIDGTWETHQYLGGLKEDMADIAPFGKNVPKEVQDLVNGKREELENGTLDIFKGPIYDNKGELVVKDGASLTIEEILGMTFLVKGVNGSIPE